MIWNTKYIFTKIEYDNNRAISFLEIQNEKTGVVVFEWSSKKRAMTPKSSPRKREEMAEKKSIPTNTAEAPVEAPKLALAS